MKSLPVLILAATDPLNEGRRGAIIRKLDSGAFIDMQLAAFKDLKITVQIVLGKQAKDAAKRYPGLSIIFNSIWAETKSVGSLFCANLQENSGLIISYGDVVTRKGLPQQLISTVQNHADVAIAVDKAWRSRYQRRTKSDIAIAETCLIENDYVTRFSTGNMQHDSAEFCGIAYLSDRAVCVLNEIKANQFFRFANQSLPHLFQELIEYGLKIRIVDVDGDWAELNTPQDLARFVMGSKAQTLEYLQPIVKLSHIPNGIRFSYNDWYKDPLGIVQNIQGIYTKGTLAIRSSALSEDGFECSNAGKFLSILGVDAREPKSIEDAIEKVFSSYSDNIFENQLLVQQQITDVSVSGVVLTRSLVSGAPYYVVNFDQNSHRTDTVTSGEDADLQKFYLSRNFKSLPGSAPNFMSKLIKAVKELENLVRYDALDIEFAISAELDIHIFQVRPMILIGQKSSDFDTEVEHEIKIAKMRFNNLQAKTDCVVGDKTFFGIMPDWNPAEIIGLRPNPLSFSLYGHLITDSIWANQRAQLGFRDIGPQPLIYLFAHQPYVDVRASFNSFVPGQLGDDLSKKIVNYYLAKLEKNPKSHDKIEFEVAVTALTFDFDRQKVAFKENGFSDNEISDLRLGLLAQTINCINNVPKSLADLEVLKFHQSSKSLQSGFEKFFNDLQHIKNYGTLPFAHLARAGFVAIAFLKTAVSEGLISEGEETDFMASLNTVARELLSDAEAVTQNKMSKTSLIKKYGHLRPGTYDITSSTYSSDIERFIDPILNQCSDLQLLNKTNFSFSIQSKTNINNALKALGFQIEFDVFEAFLRTSIEGREYAKFVFTKSLSSVIESLADWASSIGICREDASYLTLNDLSLIRMGQKQAFSSKFLKSYINDAKQMKLLCDSVELPPLILSEEDFDGFESPSSDPNFIGRASTSGVVAVYTDDQRCNFEGKIVLIPQADPGYDWLFTSGMSGFITAFGGANSHMAIRAAEFGIPAAIGVGEKIYSQIIGYKFVSLDCLNRRISKEN